LDFIEYTEESGLAIEQTAQNRLAIRLFADRQPLEPIGPAIRKMTFDPNLIKAWFVHFHNLTTIPALARPGCRYPYRSP
jgi:hypothetical protein